MAETPQDGYVLWTGGKRYWFPSSLGINTEYNVVRQAVTNGIIKGPFAIKFFRHDDPEAETWNSTLEWT